MSNHKVLAWFQKEVVLWVSILLAILSIALVPFDAEYKHYIQWETMILLFCLMLLSQGLRKWGVFEMVGWWLLGRAKHKTTVLLQLIFLCFFSSMLITNDVALITFVPLAIEVLSIAKMRKWIPFVVVFQTVAANLGSMFTPIGNPQNLYLFEKSEQTAYWMASVTFPYVLLAGVLLVCIAGITVYRKEADRALCLGRKNIPSTEVPKDAIWYLFLFVICVLTVLGFVSHSILLGSVVLVVLWKRPKDLLQIDYGLLITFLAFFLFIGNVSRMQVVRDLMRLLLEGRQVQVSILLSQFISNVPAMILLSEFTEDYKGLLIGTNLGGLGTMIASMASLISYRFVQKEEDTKGYFGLFTIWNIVLLVIFLGMAWLLGDI